MYNAAYNYWDFKRNIINNTNTIRLIINITILNAVLLTEIKKRGTTHRNTALPFFSCDCFFLHIIYNI